MGLLDDAIREHLDLKRRGGADPAEIEKLEREALGPVRRERGGSAEPGESAQATRTEQAGPRRVEFQPSAGETADASRETHAEMLPDIDEGGYHDEHDDFEAEEPQPKRRGLFRRRRAEPEFDEDEDEYEFDDEHGHYDTREHDELELDAGPEHHEESDAGSAAPYARMPTAEPEALDEHEKLDEHESRTTVQPPHLEFESRPPQRPRFGRPAERPHPEEPLGEPDETAEHHLPDLEQFPETPESASPKPAHGDPLKERHADHGHPTVEHSIDQVFEEEDALAAEAEEPFPLDLEAPASRDSERFARRPPEHEPPPARRRAASPDEPPAPPDEPAEGEDPLEETPDFLQDTPDHDRLWFEQRPPRDFDFDG